MRVVAVAVVAAMLGCSEPEPKVAGAPCVASSECGPGLVCDLVATPAVCAANGTADAAVIDAPPIDAARPIDAAVIDARPIDARPIDAAVDAAVDAAIDAALAQGS